MTDQQDVPYANQDHTEFDAWYDRQSHRIGGLRTRANLAWDAGRRSRAALIAELYQRIADLETLLNRSNRA